MFVEFEFYCSVNYSVLFNISTVMLLLISFLFYEFTLSVVNYRKFAF